MIKMDNHYFLDFTSEVSLIVVLKKQLNLNKTIEKELLSIYRACLMEGKKDGYANPCIVSLKDNHPLAFYLERWQKDGNLDLTINPFAIRPNYIILNWPLDELKITR